MEAYRPQGTCARQIIFEVNEQGILTQLKFLGGCSGGLQALVRFSVGKPIAEIIEICDGIKCKNDTSCPEQLAIALREYIKENQRNSLGLNNQIKRGHPKVLPTH